MDVHRDTIGNCFANTPTHTDTGVDGYPSAHPHPTTLSYADCCRDVDAYLHTPALAYADGYLHSCDASSSPGTCLERDPS